MKKVLTFLFETEKGNALQKNCVVGMFASLGIGLLLIAPTFWMGGKAYQATWMNTASLCFCIPFIALLAVSLFLFMPYLSFVADNGKHDQTTKRIMKGMSAVCSMAPAALLYSPVRNALMIPTGLHNIIGLLLLGLLYLWIVKTILRKPFRTVQAFIPLT